MQWSIVRLLVGWMGGWLAGRDADGEKVKVKVVDRGLSVACCGRQERHGTCFITIGKMINAFLCY